MSNKRPSDRLCDLLTPEMEQRNFEFKKSKKTFVRRFDLGEQRIRLSFNSNGFLVSTEPNFSICFYGLEKAYSKIFNDEGPGYKSKTTFLSLTSDFFHLRFNLFDEETSDEEFDRLIEENESRGESKTSTSLLIHPDSKIKSAANKLISAFDNEFEPLFRYYSNYDTLDEIFNSDPTSDVQFMHWTYKRISLGLILNNYLNKENQLDLIEKYRESYPQQEYLDRINQFTEFTANSDLKKLVNSIGST